MSQVIIQKGDTLWEIAQRFLGDGRRWRELAKANGLKHPDQIKPGLVITVPDPVPVPRKRPSGIVINTTHPDNVGTVHIPGVEVSVNDPTHSQERGYDPAEMRIAQGYRKIAKLREESANEFNKKPTDIPRPSDSTFKYGPDSRFDDTFDAVPSTPSLLPDSVVAAAQRRAAADRIPSTVGAGGYTPMKSDLVKRLQILENKPVTFDERFKGLVKDVTPGRTDRLPIVVGKNSYVIPADVVSGLGQGNTDAGGRILDIITQGHGAVHKAMGGPVKDGSSIPIVVAGGEYVVPPEAVASMGGGDHDAGHNILDKMVINTRKTVANHMARLPGPRKD